MDVDLLWYTYERLGIIRMMANIDGSHHTLGTVSGLTRLDAECTTFDLYIAYCMDDAEGWMARLRDGHSS